MSLSGDDLVISSVTLNTFHIYKHTYKHIPTLAAGSCANLLPKIRTNAPLPIIQISFDTTLLPFPNSALIFGLLGLCGGHVIVVTPVAAYIQGNLWNELERTCS